MSLSHIGQTTPIQYNPGFSDKRFERNELEDTKLGIEFLFEFKSKLDDLHPSVAGHIERLLSFPRF